MQPPIPQLAQNLVDSTAIRRPLHLIFSWTFTEQSARFTGKGSTRVEPQYKARLDLFGPRGETYLAAAAIGDELRLPPGAPANLIPPVGLLWSAMGVFRPPPGATLESTHQTGDTLTLGYSLANERWRFRSIRGRLQYVEWNGPGGLREVKLEGEMRHGLPKIAVYRDHTAFRELSLTLDQVNEAAPFPPDIWDPRI